MLLIVLLTKLSMTLNHFYFSVTYAELKGCANQMIENLFGAMNMPGSTENEYLMKGKSPIWFRLNILNTEFEEFSCFSPLFLEELFFRFYGMILRTRFWYRSKLGNFLWYQEHKHLVASFLVAEYYLARCLFLYKTIKLCDVKINTCC